MTSSRIIDRHGPLALFVAIVVAVMLAAVLRAHAGVGPDPLATAQASADGGMAVLTTYGPVIGGMYLAYAIASALLARYRSSSWLAQGKRLAWVTSVSGVIGAALQAKATGASWGVVAMAAIAAAFKLLSPTVGAAPIATSSSAAKLGVVALFVVVACTATQARQVTATGVVAALDCEAAHLDAQVLADAKVFAEAKVMQWLGGTAAPSADKIRADLAPIRSDLGRCAIKGALAALVAAVQPTPEAISALTGSEPPPGPLLCGNLCGASIECSYGSPKACPYCSFGTCKSTRPEIVVHDTAALAMRELGWGR